MDYGYSVFLDSLLDPDPARCACAYSDENITVLQEKRQAVLSHQV